MPIPTITSIKQLQYNLSLGAGYDGYTTLIEAVELPDEEIDEVCRWKTDEHSRICIYDSTALEALITCWEPGQDSAIHNYDFNNGWVKILRGELWLELFRVKRDKPDLISSMALHEHSSFYLNDNLGYHRFSNRSGEKAVALLFYADKVTHWSAFNEETGDFEDIKTAYDLNLDLS